MYFEGVYNQAEVWVNGHKVGNNVYGYSSFRFDITKYCNPAGQQNVVAVKVLNEGKNSRWYSGSGIIVDVWMLHTSPTYLDDWGTFITTKNIIDGKAEIDLSATIIGGNEKENLTIVTEWISPKGKTVVKTSQKVSVNVAANKVVPFAIYVKIPSLWSIDNANLYDVQIHFGTEKIK